MEKGEWKNSKLVINEWNHQINISSLASAPFSLPLIGRVSSPLAPIDWQSQ